MDEFSDMIPWNNLVVWSLLLRKVSDTAMLLNFHKQVMNRNTALLWWLIQICCLHEHDIKSFSAVHMLKDDGFVRPIHASNMLYYAVYNAI